MGSSHPDDRVGQGLAKAEKSMHPVILAASAHHRLVKIHPFIDGNGCTARLVMNLILMQNGYPPTVILRTDRQSYYRVLSLADDGRKSLINFVGKSVERSPRWYLNANKNKLGKPAKLPNGFHLPAPRMVRRIRRNDLPACAHGTDRSGKTRAQLSH
ncbi:MAG: Fic family protein [Anaerolineales bacterium]